MVIIKCAFALAMDGRPLLNEDRLYEWMVKSFGLTSALSTFMKLMIASTLMKVIDSSVTPFNGQVLSHIFL